MISPTTSPQYFAPTASASSSATGAGTALGKDAFLKMLVAQLKNQDPMNPMDGKDLAAQLAQFSSVEQLTQLNTAIATQTQVSQMDTLVGQSALSASLIGRNVEAVGNSVVVDPTTPTTVKVDIAGTGGAGTLTLKDANGNVVATRDLGPLRVGDGQTLTLPADLPAGKWSYSVDVKAANGKTATVTTYETGVVSAVEFKNGNIVLTAGGLEIPLSDLVRIEPATPPVSTAGGGGVASGIQHAVMGVLGLR